MIQVYCYDKNGYFTVSKFVDEVTENMTADTWEGLYKPKRANGKWIEGATQEEIDEINGVGLPQPVDKIIVLEHENKLLKAKVEAFNMTTDFHEECLVELASIVYA